MIDLHCHSTCSDGSLSPTELFEAAARLGMKALALTDHDTIAGWSEARLAAERTGVEFVPGVELSTLWKGRPLHVLGFYPDEAALRELLLRRLRSRRSRSERMFERLAVLGMPLEHPVWCEGEAPGRPHIAALMVEKGYVGSKREAFDLWIGEGRPAYVPYEPYGAAEGVADLARCGAIPVWAHPGTAEPGDVEIIFAELARAGLMGIEAHHPAHSSGLSAGLVGLAERHGMLVTGGSDYHGPLGDDGDKTHAELDGMALPLVVLDVLKTACHGPENRCASDVKRF